MPESSFHLMSQSFEDFLSPTNLQLADSTVTEIFQLMFGFEIGVVEPQTAGSSPSAPDERTAIVGFSGAMRGSCQIRIGVAAARSITSAMLGGMPIDEDDDSINDALGELCNMLAGNWKNGISSLSSECALSPPTVISGRHYKIHMTKPTAVLSRTYQFDSYILHLTLCREEPGSSSA